MKYAVIVEVHGPEGYEQDIHQTIVDAINHHLNNKASHELSVEDIEIHTDCELKHWMHERYQKKEQP